MKKNVKKSLAPSTQKEWRARFAMIDRGGRLLCVLVDGETVRVAIQALDLAIDPVVMDAKIIHGGDGIVLVRKDGTREDVALDRVRYAVDTSYRSAAPSGGELGKRIAKRIKNLRLAQGRGLREMSRLADMTAPNYSRIEGGEHVPTLDVLLRIAKALGVTVDDLVRV